MSQKVRIVNVKHAGCSVYLGDDPCHNHVWTRNAERIMDWLCDGWRSRYNQHRAQRPTRRLVEDVRTHERMWVDVPLGGPNVDAPLKDSEAPDTVARSTSCVGATSRKQATRSTGGQDDAPAWSPSPAACQNDTGVQTTPRHDGN